MDSFFIDAAEYNKETARLTPAEDGIYWRLLRLYFQTEKPLDSDMVYLCRKIGISSKNEKNSLRKILEDFFLYDTVEGCWWHERCEAQIAAMMDRKSKRQAAANIRWEITRAPKATKSSATRRKQVAVPAKNKIAVPVLYGQTDVGVEANRIGVLAAEQSPVSPLPEQQTIFDLDDALSNTDRVAQFDPAFEAAHKPGDGANLQGDYNLTNKETVDEPFVLPEWVDAKIWDAFLEMRKKKKATPTERAKKMVIEKLEEFMAKGYNPDEVIKMSIINDWKGVFEPKDGSGVIQNHTKDTKITNKTDFSQVNYGNGGRL